MNAVAGNQSFIVGSTNRNRALCKDSIVLLEKERERGWERVITLKLDALKAKFSVF